MADQAKLDCLRQGVKAWNTWRTGHADTPLDLSRADLRGMNLIGANFSGARLDLARLNDADLSGANLCGAHLHGANLSRANLTGTDLRRADLTEAKLFAATLFATKLNAANLSHADLRYATLVRTRLEHAILTDCIVYGAAAWDVRLTGSVQANLVISPPNSPRITVDNLEVAQFLYLMLHNQKLRDVLDAIASKVVLILGRFSADRKPALEQLREALRNHPNGYLPVLFDFEPQQAKPILDTVKTLASLCRFVIADLTDPNMVRSELTYITANLLTTPVRSLIEGDAALPTEYATWERYKSFVPVHRYANLHQLLASLDEVVIVPVEQLVRPTPRG